MVYHYTTPGKCWYSKKAKKIIIGLKVVGDDQSCRRYLVCRLPLYRVPN